MRHCITLMLLACLAIITQAANPDANESSSSSWNNNKNNIVKRAPQPPTNDKEEQTLRNELEVKDDGTYRYAYETTNGIVASEEGQGGVAVQGSSSYTSPEGVEIKISYVADETGYHPIGDHIPKIPDYILRSLEYIRTHPFQVKDYYSGQTKEFQPDHDAFRTVTASPKTIPLHFKTSTSESSTRKRRHQINQRPNRGSIKYFIN